MEKRKKVLSKKVEIFYDLDYGIFTIKTSNLDISKTKLNQLEKKIKSRSVYFDFFKKYIESHSFIAINNVVAGFLSEVLGFSERINSKKYKSLYAVFTKFIEDFRKKGFLELHLTNSGNNSVGRRNTWKVINKKALVLY